MNQEELNLIEAQMNEAKEDIKVGEAFQRLLSNDDYKLVYSEGYLGSYPKELGEAIATNTGAYDPEKLHKDLDGINTFIGYGFQIAGNHKAGIETVSGLEEHIKNSVEGEPNE